MIEQIKYCFIDVETTGTDFTNHGIIQIAGILCRQRKAKLFDEVEFNFKVAPFPEDIIELDALSVTGLSQEEIQSFEKPKSVHSKLTNLLGTYCDKFDKKDKMFFLGYNAQFDSNFLRRWFDKVGDKYFGSWFWNPPVDIMSLAAVHLLDVRNEMADFKLATVAKWLNIDLNNAHDALADVRATKELFLLVRGLTHSSRGSV
jgi:DNA polymerase-3 subunit epsilon